MLVHRPIVQAAGIPNEHWILHCLHGLYAVYNRFWLLLVQARLLNTSLSRPSPGPLLARNHSLSTTAPKGAKEQCFAHRAKGGAGLTLTEGTFISQQGAE